MQIYALDINERLVSAGRANKQQDYICLECRNSVRLRSGAHRQAHFYHIQPNIRCTLHAKGIVHLALQAHLKLIIPEVELECRFPLINRIADCAWHSEKIVFEVQCSHISADELKKRTDAYRSSGYSVVWIFHDQRYNQEQLSSAEDFVQEIPHFFSNMDAEGKGEIYDQFSFTCGRFRAMRLPRLPVDLSSVRRINGDTFQPEHYPPPLFKRMKEWPLSFSGDLLDRLQNPKQSDSLGELLLCKLQESWKVYTADTEMPLSALFKQCATRLLSWYRVILNYFLEKACQ